MDATNLNLDLSSPAQAASSMPVTLGDVLRAIEGWTELPPARRRDLASAVRTAAGIIGAAPETVPAGCRHLNGTLFRKVPAVAGLGGRRFGNVVSGVRFCLRRLGLHAPERRGLTGLGPTWRDLLAGLDPFDRMALARLARWADGQGLQPRDIGSEHFRRFGAWLLDNEIAAGLAAMPRRVARVWNEVAAGTSGAIPVEAEPGRKQYVLPLDAYPECSQADAQSFIERIGGGVAGGGFATGIDPFVPDAALSPRKPVRPATAEARMFQIRQAAAALVHRGLEPTALRSLRDLVERLTGRTA